MNDLRQAPHGMNDGDSGDEEDDIGGGGSKPLNYDDEEGEMGELLDVAVDRDRTTTAADNVPKIRGPKGKK